MIAEESARTPCGRASRRRRGSPPSSGRSAARRERSRADRRRGGSSVARRRADVRRGSEAAGGSSLRRRNRGTFGGSGRSVSGARMDRILADGASARHLPWRSKDGGCTAVAMLPLVDRPSSSAIVSSDFSGDPAGGCNCSLVNSETVLRLRGSSTDRRGDRPSGSRVDRQRIGLDARTRRGEKRELLCDAEHRLRGLVEDVIVWRRGGSPSGVLISSFNLESRSSMALQNQAGDIVAVGGFHPDPQEVAVDQAFITPRGMLAMAQRHTSSCDSVRIGRRFQISVSSPGGIGSNSRVRAFVQRRIERNARSFQDGSRFAASSDLDRPVRGCALDGADEARIGPAEAADRVALHRFRCGNRGTRQGRASGSLCQWRYCAERTPPSSVMQRAQESS